MTTSIGAGGYDGWLLYKNQHKSFGGIGSDFAFSSFESKFDSGVFIGLTFDGTDGKQKSAILKLDQTLTSDLTGLGIADTTNQVNSRGIYYDGYKLPWNVNNKIIGD
jgi:hypothetical protein